MPIRDLLQAQAEQMGKAIGKVLVDVLDLKSTGKLNEGIEQCNQELSSSLNVNFKELLNLSFAALKTFVNQRKLTEGHLELLSQYFNELGLHLASTNKSPDLAFQKAIELLDLADEVSQTFSISRMEKKNGLRVLLEKSSNQST